MVTRDTAIGLKHLALFSALATMLLTWATWQYSLVDPWETHYGEVGRRMLAQGDWVRTQWQDEGFRSKPILTFWLIAAGLQTFGLDQGYSGEMVSSGAVMTAIRLPFILFAVMGLGVMFHTVRRFAGIAAAWATGVILLASPFYFFVGRQAITDMPMVACLCGAMMCFVTAVAEDPRPLPPLFRRFTLGHVFVIVVVTFLLWQTIAFTLRFERLGAASSLAFLVPISTAVAAAVVLLLHYFFPIKNSRQLAMEMYFAFLGVSVLAKGLPGVAVAGLVSASYIILTNRWKLLKELRLPIGFIVGFSILFPWHWAMTMADGLAFYMEYVGRHLFGRAFGKSAVNGDHDVFRYYFQQLGYGFWPWVALVPAALTHALTSKHRLQDPKSVLTFVAVCWTIVSISFFCLVQTKFHHYILPAVPALALLCGLFVADIKNRTIDFLPLLIVGALVACVVGYDLFNEPALFIEMFVFRYDRPWPDSVDLTQSFLIISCLFALLFSTWALRQIPQKQKVVWIASLLGIAAVSMLLPNHGGWAQFASSPMLRVIFTTVAAAILFSLVPLPTFGLGGAFAVAFCAWMGVVYMPAAGKHWGQRDAIAHYYQKRQVHGINIRFESGEAAAAYAKENDWCATHSLRYLTGASVSDTPTATLWIKNQRITSHPATISTKATNGQSTEIKITSRCEPFRVDLANYKPQAAGGSPKVDLDADVLLPWRLYWRGENFWTADEVWGPTDAQKTVVESYTKRKKTLVKYLADFGVSGRKYWIITETGHSSALASTLGPKMKESIKEENTESNKFSLMSFVYQK